MCMYKFYVNERRVAVEWEFSLSPIQPRRKLKKIIVPDIKMCNTAVMTDVPSNHVCKINESLFVSAILILWVTFSSSSSSSSIMPSNR